MFKPVSPQFDFPKAEQEVLRFWEENGIYEKSLKQRQGSPDFVFYEGPPTANGRPGIHHVIARAIKDIFCRYHTMKGFCVERKAGWDTHGLPVEIEVEKKLGMEGREQVIEYGIERNNAACRESVMEYKQDWDVLTRRMGYWVDLDHPYITFENSYIESAQRFDDVPRMSEQQREALDLFRSIPDEPGMALEFTLEPGDVLFASNHVTLHWRTAFTDESQQAPRHMLRLWLTVPNGRALPAHYADTREFRYTYRRRVA